MRIKCMIAVFYCLFWFIGRASEAQEQVFSSSLITVDQYIQLLQEQRDAVRSLLVSYDTSAEYDPRVEQSGRLSGLMLTQSDILAFSGEKRFAKVVSKGRDSNNLAIVAERTTVFTGIECRRREHKTFVIQSDKSAYSEINLYTNSLLWPISDMERESCSGDPATVHFLPYFLMGGGWIVSRDSNATTSDQTVRLENADASRSLWLDPNLGYALVRYIHKNPIPGESQWEFIYSQHKEVLQGVYLPYEILIRHDITDLKSKALLGSITSLLKVTQLTVNNVPDSMFVLEPQPGETVVDRINRTIYKYNPPGANTLDRATEEASAFVERQPKTNRLLRYLIPVNVAAAIIAVGVWWIRRRRVSQ